MKGEEACQQFLLQNYETINTDGNRDNKRNNTRYRLAQTCSRWYHPYAVHRYIQLNTFDMANQNEIFQ